MIYRWVIASFFIFSFGFTLFKAAANGQMKFYLVHLSSINLFATSATTTLGAVLVTLFYLERITNHAEMSTVLKIYWFLWTQSLIVACITSPFYWIFMYQGHFDTASILMYGTNTFFLLVDLCVVKHPGRYYNFLYMIIAEILYVLFTVIYQFTVDGNE